MTAEHDIDKLVEEKFFFNQVQIGVVVEVGAADPEYLSIGAHFRKLGWKVVSIEPNPHFCDMHRKKGHKIYEYACSDLVHLFLNISR